MPDFHRPPLETQNLASIQREQNFISLAQLYEAFRFYVPVFVAFLQLNPPPHSKIHHASLYSFSFTVAALIYYLSFTASTKLNISHPTNSLLFGVIAFISGSLASILLLSNLVSPLIEFIFLILWAFLSILVVHQHVPLNRKETYEKLGGKTKNIKIPKKISNLWSKNEPNLPKDG
ncbi:hypothetical protein Patl1_22379 [Pistacia atlantica]|uniref:Uncharacterized protein n=1 Tax=Pistacia atlantica TaxID=434234 RepID=A0ACC0ZX08_9ROSI|nr:hypothetical protein Patl1_22379 [Pistacia atlantica]